MKEQKKENNLESRTRGITLVALIITIIVMLILAGVVIRMTVGDNGILNQAQKAGEESKYKAEIELVEIKREYYTEGKNIGKTNLSKMQETLKNLEEVESTSFNENGDKLIVKFKDGKTYEVDGARTYWLEQKGLNSNKVIFNASYRCEEPAEVDGEILAKIEVRDDGFYFYDDADEILFDCDKNLIEYIESNRGTSISEELFDNIYILNYDKFGFLDYDEQNGFIIYFSEEGVLKIYKKWFNNQDEMNSYNIVDMIDESNLIATLEFDSYLESETPEE